MFLCSIEAETTFAKQHKPLYDKAVHTLEEAYSRLLDSPEYVTLEGQIKAFWQGAIVTQGIESIQANKSATPVKPKLDKHFADCFKKTEFILRCYRPLAQHVKNPIYSIFHVGNVTDSAAGRIVAKVDAALDEYRAWCCRSDKPEDLRRYSALLDVFINPVYINVKDFCKGAKKIGDSTIGYDIIIATARLTAILFGLHFPGDMTPAAISKYSASSWIGRSGNQRHYAYSVF